MRDCSVMRWQEFVQYFSEHWQGGMNYLSDDAFRERIEELLGVQVSGVWGEQAGFSLGCCEVLLLSTAMSECVVVAGESRDVAEISS